MDITVVGRNAEIHPNFREYVEEKVSKVTLFYPRAQRIDVELTHEPNPRRAETAERPVPARVASQEVLGSRHQGQRQG